VLSSESEFKSSTLMTKGNRNNGWSRVYANERHLFTRLLAIPGDLSTSLLALQGDLFTRLLGRSIHPSRYSRNYLHSSSRLPICIVSCARRQEASAAARHSKFEIPAEDFCTGARGKRSRRAPLAASQSPYE